MTPRSPQQPSPAPTRSIEEVLGASRSRRGFGRWLLRIIVAIVVLLALAAGGLYAWSRSASQSPSYVTQPVRRGDLTTNVTATGNLEPTNQVDIGIEVSGTVASVAVDYNDTVKEGDVLATLDTAKLHAQVLRTRAALESAKARLEQAKATVKESQAMLDRINHTRELSGGRTPSLQDVESAEAALARAVADQSAADAAISEAQANLEVAETDLTKAVVKSPINGVIITRAVEPGQTVAASLQTPTLFTIAEDLRQMELHVNVDEADVGSVQAGQTAVFSVDAYPGRSFPATIKQVRYGSETVDGVVSYITVLDVRNDDLSLRPGMTATADIITSTHANVLLVPNAALRFEPTTDTATSGGSLLSRLMPRPPGRTKTVQRVDTGATQTVWTLRNGQLIEVSVEVGTTDGIMTEIVAGDIDEGAELVTAVSTGASGGGGTSASGGGMNMRRMH